MLFPGTTPAQQADAPAGVEQSVAATASNDAAGNGAQAAEGDQDSAQPPATGRPNTQPAAAPLEIVLRDYLVLPLVGEYQRTIVTRDPIDAAIVSGKWQAPVAGDKVTGDDGKPYQWKRQQAAADGVLATNVVPGGYAFVSVEVDYPRIMILEAQRHAAVCVNGEWLAGDRHGQGWLRLPVRLKQGPNEFLFHIAQPGMKARLVAPAMPAYFIAEDATLPDVVTGDDSELWAAAPVVNATSEPLAGAELLISIDGGEAIASPLATVPPLSAYKAPLRLPAPVSGEGQQHKLTLSLRMPNTDATPTATMALAKVGPQDARRCTFVSKIDGGVQSYTLLPATQSDDPSADQTEPPGIILALHSEGVDHRAFADNYLAKPWAHIVAPSNRGEYGFDWEDWGAVDAMEALADAQARLPHDPRRVYCTGHSMGGHGAWRLGVIYPDRFAAIGPSAGWLSLWSYGGGMPTYDDPNHVQQMLLRAASTSDTLSQISNLSTQGVYVLHGDRDAHVGVAQSRFMRSRLGEFHTDFSYFERKGAGNWWGSACCDWPQMMEFFRERSLPQPGDTRQIEFATPNLGLTAECHWARVETQLQQGQTSRLTLGMLKRSRAFIGTTENVRRLSLDASVLGGDQPVRIKLDGGRAFSANPSSKGRVWLSRDEDGRWSQIARPPVGGKSPARHGGFKSVFNNNAVLVYSTGGSEEENAWSLAKARFDAQSFWLRGNGALQVMADKEFDANRQRNRNVVLYGNADTNLAWPALLSTSPVQVRGGRVRVANQGQERPEDDPGLAALFVRPRPRSETATVGVVAGVDLAGMRLTNRIRYFHSGVGLPDLTLLGPESPAEGDYGVRAVGYFGHDWGVESGDIAWRDTAL
ncbi:alpha/beta hydrolase-fold protein [Posidoniimonas polymericola]|nr:alpha/beta hydrolase-fold protein [Posidoniimonas polymericola]